MSEMETFVGWAFKLPIPIDEALEECYTFLREFFPDMEFDVELEDNGMIEWFDIINNDYKLIIGKHSAYLLIKTINSDNSEDLDIQVKPDEMLHIVVEMQEYLGKIVDYRMIVMRWYNGGDCPAVDWEW